MPIYVIDDVTRRLRDSLADLEFGLARAPARWHHALPPEAAPDAWTVAMNLAHLTIYEESMALRVLRSFEVGFDPAGERRGGDESWFYNDALALSARPIEAMLSRLRSARQQQIDVVESLGEARLNSGVTPLWPEPEHTAGWVATKTFQHTWEHGNAILQVALFAPR
jgi:DinB superfamily